MVVVEVCVGSLCHIKGSAFVIGVLQDKIRAHKLDQQVELKACFAWGSARTASACASMGEDVKGVNAQNVNDVFADKIPAVGATGRVIPFDFAVTEVVTVSIIRLKEANCRNCYKCIRSVPSNPSPLRASRRTSSIRIAYCAGTACTPARSTPRRSSAMWKRCARWCAEKTASTSRWRPRTPLISKGSRSGALRPRSRRWAWCRWRRRPWARPRSACNTRN